MEMIQCNPLLKLGSTALGCVVCVLGERISLHGWRLHNLIGQPLFDHPHTKEKDNPTWKAKQPSKNTAEKSNTSSPPLLPFLLFKWNLMYFNIGLVPPFCLYISLKRVWHYFFTPPHQIFIHNEKFPWSLLFPRLSNPRS